MALVEVPYNPHEAPVPGYDWRRKEDGTVWYYRDAGFNYQVPGEEYDDQYDEDDFQYDDLADAVAAMAGFADLFVAGLKKIWPCPLIARDTVKRAVWRVNALHMDLIRVGRFLREALVREAPHLQCFFLMETDGASEAKFIVSFKMHESAWLCAYADKYRAGKGDAYDAYGRLITDEALGEAIGLNFNFSIYHRILWDLGEDSDEEDEEEEEHDDPSPPAEPQGRSDEDSDDPK